jgi:hypothetical protein
MVIGCPILWKKIFRLLQNSELTPFAAECNAAFCIFGNDDTSIQPNFPLCNIQNFQKALDLQGRLTSNKTSMAYQRFIKTGGALLC